MADAKNWALVFRTLGVIFTVLAAVSGAGFLLADRSAQWGRRLSPSQIASLTQQLKNVPKVQNSVTIGRPDSDDEAKDVGEALKEALTAAGFTVDGVWPGPLLGSDPIGILVRQQPKDAPPGTQIAAALGAVGLASELVEYGNPGELDIYVGRKPN